VQVDATEVEFSVEELASSAPRCTDSGNADAFVSRHGQGFRYVVEWDKWLSWSGVRWEERGARGRVKHAVMLSAREDYALTKMALEPLREELRQVLLKGDAERKVELEEQIRRLDVLLKWHAHSQNASKINACAELLATRLTISLSDLDANPWLLNLSNGTLDLRTATLQSHNRDDLITHLSGVEWDESATCPTWDAFLSKAMGGDTMLSLYLQRLIGYALTALTREHVLLFFWGGGRNGKSTFFRAIMSMMGEYACAAPRNLLFQPRGAGDPHPSELARLSGKRMCLCSEVGESNVFDESKIKDLTGGDRVACRKMNEDWWDFLPTHTLFIHGQHKPRITGTDLGIRRRMRLIPWTVTIRDDEDDHELPEKLLRELPGILRWAVNGCLEWQRIGLQEPTSVLAATDEYMRESDTVGQFFTSRCRFEGGARISAKSLREAYETWCKEAGHEPQGARRFCARLREWGAARPFPVEVSPCDVREGKRTLTGWRGVRTVTELELLGTADGGTEEPN
jgi:putative DNA primase/helicase